MLARCGKSLIFDFLLLYSSGIGQMSLLSDLELYFVAFPEHSAFVCVAFVCVPRLFFFLFVLRC